MGGAILFACLPPKRCKHGTRRVHFRTAGRASSGTRRRGIMAGRLRAHACPAEPGQAWHTAKHWWERLGVETIKERDSTGSEWGP